MRKILRSLTPAWHTKVTVVEESKDLTTIKVEELIRSLMTYEMNLKNKEVEVSRKKPLALKAGPSTKDLSEDEDPCSNNSEEDEVALLTRKFRKFLRKEGTGFTKRKSQVKRNFKGRPEHGKKYEKLVCHSCRKSGHIKSECPEGAKKAMPKWKGKKK